MTLDHVGIHVKNISVSKAFYLGALKPLGYKVFKEIGEGGRIHVVGLGAPRPDFWLAEAKDARPSVHIAFAASSHAQVDHFYAAALAAGGKDNGPPGYRKQYHPMYYGAFVLDPDGNNMEAVCHFEKSLSGLLSLLGLLWNRLLGRGPACPASTQAKSD